MHPLGFKSGWDFQMKNCGKRWMEIQKENGGMKRSEKKEQEELHRELRGNQLDTEYARQRETVSRWRGYVTVNATKVQIRRQMGPRVDHAGEGYSLSK